VSPIAKTIEYKAALRNLKELQRRHDKLGDELDELKDRMQESLADAERKGSKAAKRKQRDEDEDEDESDNDSDD